MRALGGVTFEMAIAFLFIWLIEKLYGFILMSKEEQIPIFLYMEENIFAENKSGGIHLKCL